MAKMNLRIR